MLQVAAEKVEGLNSSFEAARALSASQREAIDGNLSRVTSLLNHITQEQIPAMMHNVTTAKNKAEVSVEGYRRAVPTELAAVLREAELEYRGTTSRAEARLRALSNRAEEEE